MKLPFTSLTVLSLLVLVSSCSKSNSTPDCINDKIEALKVSDNCIKAVYQYKYNKKSAYEFVADCPDFPTVVYDESCSAICESGGFAGGNSCDDFYEKAKDKKVIWER